MENWASFFLFFQGFLWVICVFSTVVLLRVLGWWLCAWGGFGFYFYFFLCVCVCGWGVLGLGDCRTLFLGNLKSLGFTM